ncbi:AAA family ATPase [Cohnella faecalis]|uniref:Tunicamycin resistance protein n=1 Tax=Cohnella faecalis TaxID=2315694 RepID=A0A398CSF8_9BACL|nr:AAA family ATPase [Cohnella faecalis]RIE05140.1 tunicamycin resistance protein [Cohnella faecalis]
MIIWINGAFGAGKTQAAHELHRRLSHSFVFDPENAGLYIRKNIPKEVFKDDFQDYVMWREFNLAMLKYIDAEYDGILIVPMTVANPLYFNEIIGSLRNDGIVVNHFTLCASKEVLLRRLRSRGEGGQSWAARQIDRCLAGFEDEAFRHHLQTDLMSIEAVAETIASMCDLPLLPDRRGAIRKRIDRVKTQIKHIRFFQ